MKCKGCEYPLWNLSARKCPECGTDFRPSEFEFVLNSVRFCCPHCQQDYYGSGPKGHLDPPEFVCVRCAAPIRMDDCVLLPTAGVQEKQTEVDVNPWHDRRERSWVGAWFATIGRSVASPVPLIRMTPANSSVRRAFWFGVLTGSVYFTLGMGWLILLLFMRPFMMVASYGMIGSLVAALLGGPLLVALVLIVWTGSAHAVLRLTGPIAHGFDRTAQAMAYSSGMNFLSAIPCFSLYLSWIGVTWWAITAGFMLREAQRVAPWRAGLAVAALPGAIVLIVAGAIAATILFSVHQRPPTSGNPPAPTVAPQ